MTCLVLGCAIVLTSSLPAHAEEKSLPLGTIDFTLKDSRGKSVSLSDFDDSRCVVLAFLGTECPLAKLYAGRLQAIADGFGLNNVAVIGIDSNVQDSVSEIESFVRHHKLTFPVLKDTGNHVADLLGAERLSQVFLLDGSRRVCYRGRIDDQYVVGIVRDQPEHEELKAALKEVLASQPVSVAVTPALGCLIGRVKTPNEDCPVTYSNQISRIFQAHCVQCHREGDVAPFSLTEYDDVMGWGPMIAEVVKEKRMPPWHADPHFGKFLNDTSLSKEDQQLIATWVENGCPQGNPDELPAPREFTAGWQLPRTPDLVINMLDKPYDVPADAGSEGVRYQNFWVESGLTEDRWIAAAEVLPGNAAVVHHIIVYAAPEKKKGRDMNFLAAFVPGLRFIPPPAGAAKKIPAGSWLRFEVHYTPNGTPQQDLSKVGFLFADPKEITHEIHTTVVGKRDFVIQPELDDQTFHASSRPSPSDVQLISLSPHMHLRGKSFSYEAEFPDGTREVLLNVPHYDFNWQTRYCLASPRTLPKGTIVHCTASFDNSKGNLANPDPSKTVRWGDQSWDEMFLGYMDIMSPVRPSPKPGAAKEFSLGKQIDPAAVMKYLDQDNDGKISRAEAERAKPLSKGFHNVDLDRDDMITLDELQAALNSLR